MPTTKRIRASADEPVDPSAIDWEKVRATTDEDIDRQIAEDPDTAPDITEDLLAGRFRLVLPPQTVDVRAIRTRLGLSQAAFARRYGFNRRTVQEWEQGRRRPEGPARLLLRLIEREPEVVQRVLAEEGAR